MSSAAADGAANNTTAAATRIVRRPVFDEHDQIHPARLVYLSLSFDHRVVDGAVAVAFTNILLRELKNPAAMLLPSVKGESR